VERRAGRGEAATAGTGSEAASDRASAAVRRTGVATGTRRPSTSRRGARAHADREQVGGLADLVAHVRLHPVPEREHGDERGDADHDAERREEGAERVAPAAPRR
jgi:hypothetical protein